MKSFDARSGNDLLAATVESLSPELCPYVLTDALEVPRVDPPQLPGEGRRDDGLAVPKLLAYAMVVEVATQTLLTADWLGTCAPRRRTSLVIALTPLP